jgi:hypothetical protein
MAPHRSRSTSVRGVDTSLDPAHESEVTFRIVLAAFEDMVDAGLGSWFHRDDVLVELHPAQWRTLVTGCRRS